MSFTTLSQTGSLIALLLIALFLCGMTPVERFQTIEQQVMFGRISKAKAKKQLLSVIAELKKHYGKHALFRKKVGPIWSFPLKGGRAKFNVGGKGSGFRPERPSPAYSFYDGNKHGGHPAHDLFIRDKDRDCRDDRTKAPVETVAMVPGVVVGINLKWKPGYPRGGRYVWLYHPRIDKLFYYAHLDRVDVKSGQVINAGQVIGTVGKSGFKRPRPCHIHLMVLSVDAGRMTSYNYYRHLK